MACVHVLVVTTSPRSSWFEVARSTILSQYPDATVRAVFAEGRTLAAAAVGGDDDLRPQALRIGPVRYVDLVLGLGARAAAWAALPWILDGLDLGGPDAADPTTLVVSDTVELFGPLDALLEPLRRAHVQAVARALHQDPSTGLAWGGCLPGVLALSGDGGELMDWWRTRTLAELAAAAAGASGGPSDADDLAWLWRDLPVGDAVVGATDPGLRVSARTVGELDLTVTEDGSNFGVGDGGAPMVLVDMDGLDPTRPWWFAPIGQEPLRRTSESAGLRALVHLAADRLIAAGWRAASDEPPTAVVGLDETPALRRWFRSLLAPAASNPSNRSDGAAVSASSLPPNPYVLGQVREFLDLLDSPEGAVVTGVSQYADLVMAHRPDLSAAFPSVRWSGRDDFVRWMWTHGLAEGTTALALLPDMPVPRPVHGRDAGPLPFGVNLVGYLTGELGLGVAARRMAAALEAAGIPVATVSYDRTSSRQTGTAARVLDAPYAFNLLVITPDQLPFFVEDVGASFLEGHYNIGLWYWETDVLTDRQISSFDWVDEVWGATEYMCRTFERYERVPVRHVPVPLVFEDPQLVPGDRERLGLDDRFTVLFSFDFLSVVDRKNPLGLVDAFCRAFDPADGARLILKGINGEVFPDKLEELLDAAANRADIDVWDRYLSSRDRLALVAAVDCYASLHRSEGLGLTMAEAMAVGTPVVATAYSGNLDFMDDSCALLVPAREVLIGEGSLYPADGHWAEPDLDVAAAHLRRLFEDPDLRARLAAEAPRALRRFGIAEVADVVGQRLHALGTRR